MHEHFNAGNIDIVLGDFDGDGDLDVVFSFSPSDTRYEKNKGLVDNTYLKILENRIPQKNQNNSEF